MRTRKNAKALYPEWVRSEAAKEFVIKLEQKESATDIVTVVENEKVVAKRLGSSFISGQLTHPTQRVYIHPTGFSNQLQIIVLFKDFSMEMPAFWIVNGNHQIAHIEGLDGHHHILPFRHNFDDVFVEWHSEDANIVELLPILPRQRQHIEYSEDEKRSMKSERNSVGTGLSVRLHAHSVGQVNIRAVISLRNPPHSIQNRFELVQTVTVIPQVVSPCNSIILKPNSSLSLSPWLNPDTSVDSIGQIYQIHHEFSSKNEDYVSVQNKRLKVGSNAPIASNIAVTQILHSPEKGRGEKKQYPLAQAASLIVSIVEPSGLNLLKSSFVTENAVPLLSRQYHLGEDQPFWSSSSSYSSNTEATYSKTENLLCEKQRVTLKMAILDELARELHVMGECRVESNDTTIIKPAKDILFGTDSIGGPMYGEVQLDALQAGYATVTFREKNENENKNKKPLSADSDLYVYDDPEFLRTFLTVHVLSSSECESQFGVSYLDSVGPAAAGSNGTLSRMDKMEEGAPTMNSMKMKMQREHKWQSSNTKMHSKSKSNSSGKGMAAICLVLVLVLVVIVCCSWSQSWFRVDTASSSSSGTLSSSFMLGGNDNGNISMFNPLANVNLNQSQNNPYMAPHHQQQHHRPQSFVM